MGLIEIAAAGAVVLAAFAAMAKLRQAADRVAEAICDAPVIAQAREEIAAPATIAQLFGKRIAG